MKPLEIILAIERGERILCPDCGTAYQLVGDSVNPAYAECGQGHRVYYVLTTEGFPLGSDAPIVSVWLQPVSNLTKQQLEVIKSRCGFDTDNLVQLRLKLCDGQRHLLCGALTSDAADCLVAEMRSHGLDITVRKTFLSPVPRSSGMTWRGTWISSRTWTCSTTAARRHCPAPSARHLCRVTQERNRAPSGRHLDAAPDGALFVLGNGVLQRYQP